MRVDVRFLVALLCLTAATFATDRPRKVAAVTREECDAWVEQLANREKRPFDESYILRPPSNVDRDALKDVKVAYDNLALHFEQALPSLVAGIADKRYSYYQEVPSNGAFVCHSVGHACHSIIRAHIEVYHRYLESLDSTQVPRSVQFLAEKGGVEKWYESRKDKPLLELQLEAVDWALNAPREERIAHEVWDEHLAELRKFRDKLAKSKKPFQPKHRLWFEGK